MKTVCTLLGLSAEADENSVHAAVSKLLNRGDITPDALVTLRAEHKARGEQIETLLGEQVDAILDGHGVTEPKLRNRLSLVLKPLKNRDERIEALADLGHKPVTAAEKKKEVKLLNRRDAQNPESPAEVETTEVTSVILDQKVRAIMNRDNIKDFSTAYSKLMQEEPALFATA